MTHISEIRVGVVSSSHLALPHQLSEAFLSHSLPYGSSSALLTVKMARYAVFPEVFVFAQPGGRSSNKNEAKLMHSQGSRAGAVDLVTAATSVDDSSDSEDGTEVSRSKHSTTQSSQKHPVSTHRSPPSLRSRTNHRVGRAESRKEALERQIKAREQDLQRLNALMLVYHPSQPESFAGLLEVFEAVKPIISGDSHRLFPTMVVAVVANDQKYYPLVTVSSGKTLAATIHGSHRQASLNALTGISELFEVLTVFVISYRQTNAIMRRKFGKRTEKSAKRVSKPSGSSDSSDSKQSDDGLEELLNEDEPPPPVWQQLMSVFIKIVFFALMVYALITFQRSNSADSQRCPGGNCAPMSRMRHKH